MYKIKYVSKSRLTSDDNELMLTDLGWCVYKYDGVLKNNIYYFPSHPLSQLLEYTLNWDELYIIQNNNFEQTLGCKIVSNINAKRKRGFLYQLPMTRNSNPWVTF